MEHYHLLFNKSSVYIGCQRQLTGGFQNQDRILQRQRDHRLKETEGLLLPQCLHSVPLSDRHRLHESDLPSEQLQVASAQGFNKSLSSLNPQRPSDDSPDNPPGDDLQPTSYQRQ